MPSDMQMKAGEGWQKDAQAAGFVVSALAELWLERYRSGPSAEVWAEMRDLGPEIRTARFWHHASAVATETMARAGTGRCPCHCGRSTTSQEP